MTSTLAQNQNAPSITLPTALPAIWSCGQTGPMVLEHVLRTIDLAAQEKAQGIELAGHVTDIDRYVRYEAFPALASSVDESDRQANEQRLHAILEHAKKHNLRVSMWHHELGGPRDMLEKVPAFRAADGLIDLDSDAVWDFVRSKVAEMFRRFPDLDELVLTMTETHYPVAHRPFCDIPVPERIRRLIQAVADVTDPLGKHLVIRPFSAVRSDELHVREAIEQVKAQHLSVMYKTEPFDWHPFLENETLIGSIKRYPARMETDCGAEYYGQTAIPCCYTSHIGRRLSAAAGRGASLAVLRVDRSAYHSSLDHPINAANLFPVARWLADPSVSLRDHLCRWLEEVHGDGSPPLADIFEATFQVICDALYIDQQSLTHSFYPALWNAKHVLAMGLFEEDVPLDHMERVWSVVPGRRTLTHAAILRQKEQAVALARTLLERFDALPQAMHAASRNAIREGLERLEIFAQACAQLVRLICAHMGEVTPGTQRVTDDFATEGKRLLAMADAIDARYGPAFFPATLAFRPQGQMAKVMREWVTELEAERALELPLRRALAQRNDLIDYVLCGVASEGHRPGKRVHCGATFQVNDRFVRETGLGEDDGFGYTLRAQPGKPMRLEVELADDQTGRPGMMSVNGSNHPLPGDPFDGFRTVCFDLPPVIDTTLRLRFWSTSPVRCRVATLCLCHSKNLE